MLLSDFWFVLGSSQNRAAAAAAQGRKSEGAGSRENTRD